MLNTSVTRNNVKFANKSLSKNSLEAVSEIIFTTRDKDKALNV